MKILLNEQLSVDVSVIKDVGPKYKQKNIVWLKVKIPARKEANRLHPAYVIDTSFCGEPLTLFWGVYNDYTDTRDKIIQFEGKDYTESVLNAYCFLVQEVLSLINSLNGPKRTTFGEANIMGVHFANILNLLRG